MLGDRIAGWLQRLRQPKPERYRPWWYSKKKGLHDAFTHLGWCLPEDGCTRVPLETERALNRGEPADPSTWKGQAPS